MISFVYRAIECRKSSNRAEEELERFDPQVVICIGHKGVESGSTLAWVELSLNPILPTKINVAGRYLERANPTVEEFLEVIDEVGQLNQNWSERGLFTQVPRRRRALGLQVAPPPGLHIRAASVIASAPYREARR